MLQLEVVGLGTELKLRTFDMTANAFLHEVCLLCPEYMGKCLYAGQKNDSLIANNTLNVSSKSQQGFLL